MNDPDPADNESAKVAAELRSAGGAEHRALPDSADGHLGASNINITGATESLQEEPYAAAMLPPGSAPRQILAAYAAAGAKVIAWVIAAAVVYRMMGPGPFALFMLLRGTLAILNYTAFGLGPAVLHFGTSANRDAWRDESANKRATRTTGTPTESLPYEPRQPLLPPERAPREALRGILLHAAALTILLTTAGIVALAFYDNLFTHLHKLPATVEDGELAAIWWLGLGVLLRAAGDVPGGAIQARGWFTLDQAAVAAADLLWAALCVRTYLQGPPAFLPDVTLTYALTGALVAASRWGLAIILVASVTPSQQEYRFAFNSRSAIALLGFGGLVTLGSIGDFLYAPIAYVILNRLVDPLAVAVYAPAVQIDAALILMVTALAAVILPRAAIRHANEDRIGIWREYVRASLAAAGITIIAGGAAWLASPWLFIAWLDDPLPATQAILPLVLLHTVLGCAGGIGRSTLIAVGRAGTYAASVLIGGLLNVGLSLAFVYAGWGIKSVILGTVISVFLRCVIWMPWYVRRTVLGRSS